MWQQSSERDVNEDGDVFKRTERLLSPAGTDAKLHYAESYTVCDLALTTNKSHVTMLCVEVNVSVIRPSHK